jgi:hypothetical protein
MKQILLAAIAFVFALNVSAQDIKKVRNYVDKKDWVKAKEAVDLMLANEKEQKNWEAWFYKGFIYGQVGKDAALKGTIPDVWNVSFEAFSKAMELDAKQTEGYLALRSYPVFDSYLELQREGNDFYNKQDYANALDKYKQADKVGRFIFKNKWALSEVDTVLYYYAGAAAMQGEKMEDAINFFQKICDAGIGGEGYDVCYRYVTYHYDEKKDYVNAAKYAALGRKLYPNDAYYDKLDLDKERKKGNGPDLFKKYEAVLEKTPKDYDMRFDYAAEIFNWLFMDQKAAADQKQTYFDKIITELKTCIQTDAAKPDAHLLMGKVYFNDAANIQDELKATKGTTPADVQKKTELKTKMESRMKEAIPHLEKALVVFEGMKKDEVMKDRRLKNEYKTTVNLLTEAYRFLGNPEKEKFYQKKYDELNQ